MSLLEAIFLALFLLSLGLFATVLIYYRYFRAYTRERFAFRVFLFIASLTTTIVFVLLAPKSTIGFIVEIVNHLFHTRFPEYEPSISDKLLSLVLVGLLIYFALALYRDWPGNISVREHDAKFSGAPPSLLSSAAAAVIHRNSPSLEPYSSGRRTAEKLDHQLSPTESKAWHIWVARILAISSNQIHIDEVKDWYVEKHLFISRYGPKSLSIGILCCRTSPEVETIRAVIEFISTQAAMPEMLVIAVESENKSKFSERIANVAVEYRFRDEMLNSLVDFSTYKNDIQYRYEGAEIAEGYSLKLPDVYVACAATVAGSTENISVEDIEFYVSSWVNEKGLRHLAVLGEYGQGKSVLALKLTHRLLFEDVSSERIPILVTLGGRSPRNQKKLGLLADWAATYDINPKALLTLHEAGRLLLIFDGFDEMDLVGEASLRLEHFRSLWEFSAERNAKIMITGRPNFFLDQVERERSLNIRAKSLEVPYTEAVYLEHLNTDRIAKALRNFDRDVSGDIINSLASEQAVYSFKDLMSRPSTLFLAANIWDDIRHSDDPSRVNSAEVIGRFIQHCYDRQQRKGLPAFLTSDEREYFTAGVAVAMLRETQYSNHLTSSSLQKAITTLLDNFPEELQRFCTAADPQKMPLKERLQDRELLIETISTDVRSCGVIVSDLSQFDAFKFAHKSFFELLLAKNVVFSIFSGLADYFEIDGYGRREIGIHRAVTKALDLRSIAATANITAEVEVFAAEILFKFQRLARKHYLEQSRSQHDLEMEEVRRTRYHRHHLPRGMPLSVRLQLTFGMNVSLNLLRPALNSLGIAVNLLAPPSRKRELAAQRKIIERLIAMENPEYTRIDATPAATAPPPPE